jgi:acetate---CoA ligase (ADP-forming)
MTLRVPGARPGRALVSMLEARSIAIVGASDKEGSFGRRAVEEVAKSSADPEVHLVNPRLSSIGDKRCVGSLDEIDGAVDLVMMCVPDAALESEMQKAADRKDRSAVVFGSAFGARERIRQIAAAAGMAVCGAGCMGFVNVRHGLRVIGYVEPDPVDEGPLALVSCSGSAFSALLRTHRQLGWTLAVSSGQELVTPACAYVDYAIDVPDTRVVALLLEQMSDASGLKAVLQRAAEQDVAVVALTVGTSVSGRQMVEAHSGALAGSDAAWEALFDACGVLRVADIDEMADTLELLSSSRRAASCRDGDPSGESDYGDRSHGIATVHDSGAERALVVDLATDLSVPFARIGAETEARLDEMLDPGLEAGNPLDLWGTGADTADRFRDALLALADDPTVDAVALCVDLVYEFDDDDSYEQALYDVFEETTKPVALLSNLHSAMDPAGSGRLRDNGIPVLEGTRSGLLALGHLVELRDFRDRPEVAGHDVDEARRSRWLERLSRGALSQEDSLSLVADYGIRATVAVTVAGRTEAEQAAEKIGLPVVLKTAAGVSHKSDFSGVIMGLESAASVGRAYDDLAKRLGPAVLVAEQVSRAGVEIALGLVNDPGLGPIVVVGAGGVLVELMSDRAVGLPPIDLAAAYRMIDRLAVRALLDGLRGAPPVDVSGLAQAIVSMSQLADELGPALQAVDVNPLLCTPEGVVALDALFE